MGAERMKVRLRPVTSSFLFQLRVRPDESARVSQGRRDRALRRDTGD